MERDTTILVVDDDEGLNKLITRRLDRAGFDVSGVHSGAEALAFFADQRVDLLLVDLMLSDMPGAELIEALREKDLEVPFVVITGHGDERVAVDMMKQGALDYLTKDGLLLDVLPTVIEKVEKQIDQEKRLKEAEQKLIQTERLRAVGELSAGVSHNLNNILTAILGPASMIKQRTEDAELQQDAELIMAASLRARELIQQLHQTVKGDKDAVGPVDLTAVIHNVVDIARPRWKDQPEARGIAITVEMSLQNTLMVKGTQGGIYNALLNLMINAVDAMPRGGTIKIATSSADGYVILKVEDTGIGMNEETRLRVFEPFFTTKMEVGTGLGLATVFGTVTHWGGDVRVESEEGQGSVFEIRLPVWEGQEDINTDVADFESGRQGRVLVVDDENTVRRVLQRILSLDHTVVGVDSSQKALAEFRAESYDAVVLDLGMPELPGDQLACRLRKIDPCVGLVLVTGWQLESMPADLSQFDQCLQKPFTDPNILRHAVRGAIEKRDQRKA